MQIKNVAGLVSAVALVGAGLTGGAMGVSGAYFTDEQVGSKSTITAGAIGIGGLISQQKVSVDGLMPGDEGSKEMFFKVTDGDAWFRITASTTKDDLGGNLSFNYELYQGTTDASGTVTWLDEPLRAQNVDGGMTNLDPIAPGEYKVVAKYKLSGDAGNEYQGKKYEGNFKFDVYQAKNVVVNPFIK